MGNIASSNPSRKRKEVIKFLFGTSLIREGPWETERERKNTTNNISSLSLKL